jgi:hypothetical protein
MKAIVRLLLLITLSNLFVTFAKASEFYRQRLPLTQTMTTKDRLQLSYDFSTKAGIHCSSSDKHVRVNFTHKGKQKSALLPLTLQDHEVPHNQYESLADKNGRLLFYMDKPGDTVSEVELNCAYIESK